MGKVAASVHEPGFVTVAFPGRGIRLLRHDEFHACVAARCFGGIHVECQTGEKFKWLVCVAVLDKRRRVVWRGCQLQALPQQDGIERPYGQNLGMAVVQDLAVRRPQGTSRLALGTCSTQMVMLLFIDSKRRATYAKAMHSKCASPSSDIVLSFSSLPCPSVVE